ncbi:LAFE_0G10110g1_1 [Lachancea fermentati]|uniref:RNA polymerase II transcription factor B subunit 2 n=1 Tax=Lachancea fermentati TaxID=4955 RepID=A0A1G4MHV7_LACFM|nr:LAFE_0G10110g1_1 [Lachancea fermentati]
MSATLFKATVNEYLEDLPPQVQSRLYASPATCLAIYRLLPKLAKFFIMSMVFNESDISLRDLDRWVKSEGKFQFNEAIKSMKSLHLLIEGKTGQPFMINLNPIFRSSFRNALTGGEVNNSFGNVIDSESDIVSMAMLDQYAADKWETILHFMVGTPLTKTPSRNVLNLLTHSKLMENSSSGELQITNEGFQFLLQDVNAQIWTLLLQYLRMAETLQMDPVDVLNFIFMLGALELGKAYSDVGLSETQKVMLQDMRDYGLVFQKASNAKKFYPTRLATMLTSDTMNIRTASGAMNSVLKQGNSVKEDASAALAAEEEAAQVGGTTQNIPDGALILETNFKLYSYSNSPLQIAILSLFVHLKSRFTNMVTGQITRESIRRALYNGITADQIIAYLETHAHPQMRRLAEINLEKKLELDQNCKDGLQILPPTVVDQIKLWQLELDRIISYDGYLFSDFEDFHEYHLLSTYASDIGVLLWKDEKKRRFFVSQEGNAQVIDYAKRKLKKK